MIAFCKTCGTLFNSDEDEFGNPLESECNNCWADNECKSCEEKDCENCHIYNS